MPDETPVENPTENPPPKKRNERTEAKFLEDADKLIAEAGRLGAEYTPPNAIAELAALTAKRDAVRAQRTVNQAKDAALETTRNERERLYKPLRSDVGSLVEYAKSAGVAANDIAALKSIHREIKGERAAPRDASDGGAVIISVAQTSYASLADHYARFVEQYASLRLTTTENMYQAATHRARLAAMRAANTAVIGAQAAADQSSETLDRLAFTDADSLLKGCVSGKSYIKSKYKTSGEPYKNIAKTRFNMPSRLR